MAEDLNARNLRIARERLAELEAERDNGNLTPDAFEQANPDNPEGRSILARSYLYDDAIQEQSPMAEGQKSEGEPTEEKGATEAKISVRVELGPKLQAQVSADDTLFILTRSSHKDAQFSPYL